MWVVSQIVEQDDVDQRAEILSYFIKVCYPRLLLGFEICANHFLAGGRRFAEAIAESRWIHGCHECNQRLLYIPLEENVGTLGSSVARSVARAEEVY